jgi:dTDP-4-dehydrorhamnose 3,5-epimerase
VTVKLHPTHLEGLVLVEVPVFEDARGFFMESWNRRAFAEAGLDAEFVQDNHSRSGAGVLRGLHYQGMTAPLSKLVRCTQGSVFDVGVDLRTGSKTFGQWFGVELSARNHKQIYIPVGFAHGFVTLSESAEIQYKQTGFYDRSAEVSIRWNDPDLAIEWPVRDPLLSERDKNDAISFAEYRRSPAFGD